MNTLTYDKDKHNYCIIMAGGIGRRLWPVSRTERPKQFIDFIGTGRTLLQHTYDRFKRIIPQENIYVCTFKDYVNIVKEQLPELTDEQILVEPVRRNTAPIAAWAAHRITLRDKEASLIISPADQTILNEIQFYDDVNKALAFTKKNECFIAMGITPSRPEPGYGYIQMGDAFMEGEENKGFFKTKSFIEKPERQFAEMFIQSGEFLWNTGLFVCTVTSIYKLLHTLLPSVMRTLDAGKEYVTWQEENEWVDNNYAMYPNLSIESGVLERSQDVCIMKCGFLWADIGSWHGLYESYREYDGANVVLSPSVSSEHVRSYITESSGNIISLPKGHVAVINGLDNYIVAEHDDVLLITPRNDHSAQIIRQLDRYDENIMSNYTDIL